MQISILQCRHYNLTFILVILLCVDYNYHFCNPDIAITMIFCLFCNVHIAI